MNVIYERDPDVGNGFSAYRGRIEGGEAFIGLHFEALIRLIHRHLASNASDTITFIRCDRPGLSPYPMDGQLVELIKTDPEAAIQKMSVPDQRIVVGRDPAPLRSLRICTDTLSSAFGERVLCRAKEDKVECPGCGKWGSVPTPSFHCERCGVTVPILHCDSNWAFISVSDLLQTNLDRFFLPREWNGFKPWVSKTRLKELHESFLSAKENFHVCS